jgi:hypothetical protein
MPLPNPLSKVNEQFQKVRRRRSIVEHVAQKYSMKGDLFGLIAKLAKTADRMALACLWIAIEMDNILVLADNAAYAQEFIKSISTFVPFYKKVIEINNGSALDRRINFLNPVTLNNYLRPNYIKLIGDEVPDRVINKNPKKSDIDGIFSLSKEGIPFIMPIFGNFVNRQTVKLLQSRRFGIRPNNIQVLDMTVMLVKGNDNFNIETITEYKWLDRGEIRIFEVC